MIDPIEESKLDKYLSGLKTEPLRQLVRELYLYGEMGKKTVKTLIDEYDKMFRLD